MNKLYLLLALGLSAKADISTIVGGTTYDSSAWYAGDCLDVSQFSTHYGHLDFNCGSACSNVPTVKTCTNNYSAYCAEADLNCQAAGVYCS